MGLLPSLLSAPLTLSYAPISLTFYPKQMLNWVRCSCCAYLNNKKKKLNSRNVAIFLAALANISVCCHHCEVTIPSEQHNVLIIMMERADVTITCTSVCILRISSRHMSCKFGPSCVQQWFVSATFNPEDVWGAGAGNQTDVPVCFPVWFDAELLQGPTFSVGKLRIMAVD